jgi:hypothetical protein
MSGFLDADLINDLREVYDLALDGTCQVERKTGTGRDGIGGRNTTWNEAFVGKCRTARVIPERPATEGEKKVNPVRWEIYVPFGTDVKSDDRITITGDAIIYHVETVGSGHEGAYGIRCVCRKRE